MIELWLIRHGQTFDNITKTLAGHTPGKLTELGEKQALKTGEFLKEREFDFAYVSDLARTVSTFKNIHSQMSKKIPEERITLTSVMREKGGGEFEGKPLELFRNTAASKKIPLRQFKGKGGECWDDVNVRAQKLLVMLAANHLWDSHGVVEEAGKVNAAAVAKGVNHADGDEEEEVKVNHEDHHSEGAKKVGGEEGVIRIMGVSHGGFIMEVHNVIDYLQFKKNADINNVAKNCSIHKIRIQLKKGQNIKDSNSISIENLIVTVLEKNNDEHCSNVVV